MQYTALIAASLMALASAQNVENPSPAAAIYDNPVGQTYAATFESDAVTGSLTFTAGAEGAGVDITVNLEGFKGEVGPFGYHIHDQPVPADGNCTGTKAHLDPYGRGQVTPCDKTQPETCEVGDLAGKHGKIPNGGSETVQFSASYNDLYASTKEGIGAFLGNRSIVIHRNDTTRLACVNILLVDGGFGNEPTEPANSDDDDDSYPVPTPSGTAPTYGGNSTNGTVPSNPAEPSATDVFTGSAATYGISSVITVGGLLAGLMMAL